MNFDIHSTLHLLALAACVYASIYLIYKGQKQVGIIFLAGFILILQLRLYLQFIGIDPSQGECWADQGSYYQCQPLMEKLSYHASHLGYFLLALGLLTLGLKDKTND